MPRIRMTKSSIVQDLATATAGLRGPDAPRHRILLANQRMFRPNQSVRGPEFER